ncbi:MAG TPA: hypothetical protein DCQ06_12080 [Myxococcales bacterium]|nr:hypothetical protein [Myxococcales bacterium]HAN32325.1 hypothetical protein [Myxococcales bacterium]
MWAVNVAQSKQAMARTLASLVLLGGCTSPCGDLVARVCKAQGAQSVACEQVQAQAASGRIASEKACTNAIEFIDELKRTR